MLEEGYYHSDPHPGNLLRTASGDLAYIVSTWHMTPYPSFACSLTRALQAPHM